MTILGYWEMGEKDAPPEEYYGNDEAITDWFKAVKARRENPGGSADEGLEIVPQTSNEYVKEVMGW